MIEVGPREMVIALGAVVALATTLQIMRRIRNSRYENIQMPNKKNDFIANEDQEATEWSDVDRSEFPSGGARIVTRDDNNLEAKSNPDNSININHSTLNIDSSYHSDLEQKELKAHRKKSINDANSGHNYSANSIVVLHLEAKENKVFHGERLLNIFLTNGLRYGTKKIFHYHESAGGSDAIIFSLANSMQPGIFDLDQMSTLTTPSISLFLVIEDHEDPIAALNILLNSAKKIATELDGDLKDDSRSAFTKQTEDHYRQRIIDFNRIQIPGI
jgi:cell division protein ZipA